MIAYLYGRVSTDAQDSGMQIAEMIEFCKRREWSTEIFADEGFSGSKTSRPEFDRMMAAARKRRCDVIVVYRFDRFARSTKQLVDALEEFRALGIQFVSLHENIDTSTPVGKLAFTIFAAIAEFERELIRERVRSGLKHAREKGRIGGRPRKVLDVAQIREWRAAGSSWRTIATKLGVSHATVITALKSAAKAVKKPPKKKV